MEEKQILVELNKNLEDFRLVDDKISMIKLAIYQKEIQGVKNNKLKEIKKYFEDKVEFYEQNILDYQKNIDEMVKKYENEINKLIKAYDYLYSNIFQNLQKAINNQMIAIGNIVTLYSKRNKENFEDINKQIMAILQKKVNYSVIVEECKARLDWCIENGKKDINEIFENKFYQLDICRNSFFDKIKRRILNIINGKKKVIDVFNKYRTENFKNIMDKNEVKTIEVIAITSAILKQIKNVEEQISSQYAQSF